MPKRQCHESSLDFVSPKLLRLARMFGERLSSEASEWVYLVMFYP